MKKLTTFMICILLTVTAFSHEISSKQILIINSHDKFEPSKTILVDQLIKDLKEIKCTPDLIYEDLDAPQILSQAQLDTKRKEFVMRCKTLKPDLVIYLYNSGFQLVQQEVYDLWGDIPTILYSERQTMGANNVPFFKKMISEKDSLRYLSEFNKRKNFTVVYNKVHIYETISMLTEMIPEVRDIGFIYDNKWNDIHNAELFKRYMKQYFPDIRMHLFSNKTLNTVQLLDSINRMPAQSALIYSSWTRVKRDELSAYYDSRMHNLISGLSKHPIFTIYDYGVKEGVFAGGFFPFTKSVFSTISESAVEKLFPRPFSRIDQSVHVIAYPVLNYRYITDHNLSVEGLKAEPFFYDRPKSFFEEHEVAIILSGFILGMLIVSGFLVILYLRRSRQSKQRELERTKKMMLQLVEAKEKAEESERMKSAFLANISHEIRTPLNSIVGFSDIIATSELKPKEKAEFIKTIHFNNDLLLRLIDDLLLLSGLDNNKEEFVFELFDLYPVMQQIQRDFRYKLTGEQTLVFEANSPKCQILSDKNRLTQVVINLISNAIKFTPHGTISYGYDRIEKDDLIRFYVKDTGKGIPKDQMGKIFDRFYKADSFTQGTGLGLPICKSIINKLGGCIDVESEKGVGTTILFYLPMGL